MKSADKNGVHSPETLVMLHRVLEDSFNTIVRPDQVSDAGWQQDMRIRLAQVILTAHDHGVRDPERLKRTAIKVVKPPPIRAG